MGNVLLRATESFARLRATRRASNVVDGARSGGEAATWILAATDRAGDSATRLATGRRDRVDRGRERGEVGRGRARGTMVTSM